MDDQVMGLRPLSKTIDLNSDVGEGFGAWSMGDDIAMLDLVSSVNIACGFHAGDPAIMRRTVKEAVQRGVAIGAHPGFDDLRGFGRRRMEGLSSAEIEDLVAYQVGALMGIAALEGAAVTHVKVHGALSNMACDDERIATAVATAVGAISPQLAYVVMPRTEAEKAGEKLGLKLIREVFADRNYLDDLRLVPRRDPDALLHEPAAIKAHIRNIVSTGTIVTRSGSKIKVPVDTICIHSDTPGAADIGRAVRRELEAAGITLAPFSRTAR